MADVGNVIARGNVAAITGGVGGISLAVAEQLIERGMRVVLADINAPKLHATASRLTEACADVSTFVCDTASDVAVAGLEATGSPVGVNVLCPGFVRTDLMDAEPDHVDSPMGALMNEVVASGVADGMPANDVATEVVDAVDTNRFWILTHADMRELPVERMQRAATQMNPPTPFDEADAAPADGQN